MAYHKKYNNKKRGWIYPNDLCWLKSTQEAYPAKDNWEFSNQLIRILYSDEPIRYVRRTRLGRGGPWVHHIECLGLKYVYRGSIKDFTKQGPTKAPSLWD